MIMIRLKVVINLVNIAPAFIDDAMFVLLFLRGSSGRVPNEDTGINSDSTGRMMLITVGGRLTVGIGNADGAFIGLEDCDANGFLVGVDDGKDDGSLDFEGDKLGMDDGGDEVVGSELGELNGLDEGMNMG
mmetsp:Transcript_8623/g.18413  ORF Transcript_8623/g.18413 Transcript_8623/m.18413 type:complete len:131 (-) Transcript_8623:1246-1638(-)